jgi:sulfate adenylyltransferase
MKSLVLSEEQVVEAKNIGWGVYAPLKGFLKKKDFERVLSEMRLTTGDVWTIPVVLDVAEGVYDDLKKERDILLLNEKKERIAVLRNIEFFEYDKNDFVKKVFGTEDASHPGVNEIQKMNKYLVGGEIEQIDYSKGVFAKYIFTPEEARVMWQNKGWRKVVAFQTRNVPHRPHEFLQKVALREVDGLFIQPVIGKKKNGDFKDEVILAAYESLIAKHYSEQEVQLGALLLKMRYAGPREAIFHALIRKNYGCTHFIVGRDHAGVGDYYGKYDAQNIFNNFTKDEIGIEILKYENASYCSNCSKLVFEGDCDHNAEGKVFFSGTKMREIIKNKEKMPPEFIRSEVLDVLLKHPNPFVS